MDPRKTGWVESRKSRSVDILSAPRPPKAAISGSHEHDVADLDSDAGEVFGRLEIFGEHRLTGIEPFSTLGTGYIQEDSSRHNPSGQGGDIMLGCAGPGGHCVRGTAVIHLPVPENVGKCVHMSHGISMEDEANELSGPPQPWRFWKTLPCRDHETLRGTALLVRRRCRVRSRIDVPGAGDSHAFANDPRCSQALLRGYEIQSPETIGGAPSAPVRKARRVGHDLMLSQ